VNYNREKLWENELINRFLNVKKTLADTALDAGRDFNDINLLAVSKRHAGSSVKVLIDAGHRLFGENQVQEALSKFPKIIDQAPDLSLHMIGSLQTNKVREAVAIFDVIETLDRSRLAKALAKERDKSGKCPDLFIQVNTGEEPQKSGVLPSNIDNFIAQCRGSMELPITGLMCIPPLNEEPAMHFGLLAECARRNDLEKLSMGMSSDYETAIRLGATEIRVGTGIFGDRAGS
tara:strand:+ start:7028 stop:7726 length:699 start_codon:yes stop_codon:yes gene_type:complete